MKLLFSIFLVMLPLLGFGQLVTSTAQSPAALVQNVLLGSGVTVSNISFNGSPISIGYFDGSNTNIGLASGIIMTTGTVFNTGEGPHGPNNSGSSGMNNGAPGFGLLSSQIGGTQTFNSAILEFDFQPYSDTVRFNYVFGSEEYLEYVGSQFNDVFGFFISGPGIPGGLQNIAKLPNGQVVAINNVNGGNPLNGIPASNQQYYVNNGDGSSAPQNSSPTYVQYDGFTKVLTAESKVQCGETYHLIITIADAGDEVLDSGIFLEANSLSSNTPVEVSHVVTPNLFNNPDIVAEGCASSTVTLRRGGNTAASSLTIPILVSGTATEGIDYSNIPNSITFPAGVQQVQFSFDAFQDGLAEGQETVQLTFPIVDPCGNTNPIVLDLIISDVQPVDVEITGNSMLCPEDSVVLVANASGGGPPYTYLWSTGETTPTITLYPDASQNYWVSVTDNCLGETATDTYEVVVPLFLPLVLSEISDIEEICPFVENILQANASGGSAPYSYQWSSNFDPDLGTGASLITSPGVTTTFTVTVTDICGNEVATNVLYTITSPPLVVEMTPTTEICPNDSLQLTATVSGGYGQYYYDWPHSGETMESVWVSPGVSTTYNIIVSDDCQTFTVPGSTQVLIIQPTADFTITSELQFNHLPVQFTNLSEDAVTYDWDFGDFNTSTDVHPQNIYDDPGIYVVTLIAYDKKGCTDTISRPIEIEEEWYIYVPNTFTPDGNRFNNFFSASTVGIERLSVAIFNRWGEAVFTSDDKDFVWDGSYSGSSANDGTYTYKIEFLTNSGRERAIFGHVNLLR